NMGHAGPEVAADDQVVKAVALAQRTLALGADRLGVAPGATSKVAGLVGDGGIHLAQFRPGLLLGFARQDIDPHAEADFPVQPLFLDGAPSMIDHLLLLRQGFAPGQMNVAKPGGYAHGRIAGTGQPDPRQRVLVHWIFGAAVLHPEVLALKGKGLAGVVALDVVEKLLGALITPVMVDEVAIG